MDYILNVPEPCSQLWNEMTEVAGGRHCAVCSKTVIDFTGWQPQDIVDHIQGAGHKVCGRFRKEQLDTPITHDRFILAVATSAMPLTRKVAAIFLLAFGLLSLTSTETSAQVQQHKVADSARHSHSQPHIITGEAPMPQKNAKKTTTTNTKEQVKPQRDQPMLTGLVDMEQLKPKKDTGKKK